MFCSGRICLFNCLIVGLSASMGASPVQYLICLKCNIQRKSERQSWSQGLSFIEAEKVHGKKKKKITAMWLKPGTNNRFTTSRLVLFSWSGSVLVTVWTGNNSSSFLSKTKLHEDKENPLCRKKKKIPRLQKKKSNNTNIFASFDKNWHH